MLTRLAPVLLLLVGCVETRYPMANPDDASGSKRKSLFAEEPSAPKSQTQFMSSTSSSGCMSDADCSGGSICLHGGGNISGHCGRPVDSSGNPTFNFDRKVASCSSDTDCPAGFRCSGTGFEKVCSR